MDLFPILSASFLPHPSPFLIMLLSYSLPSLLRYSSHLSFSFSHSAPLFSPIRSLAYSPFALSPCGHNSTLLNGETLAQNGGLSVLYSLRQKLISSAASLAISITVNQYGLVNLAVNTERFVGERARHSYLTCSAYLSLNLSCSLLLFCV